MDTAFTVVRQGHKCVQIYIKIPIYKLVEIKNLMSFPNAFA